MEDTTLPSVSRTGEKVIPVSDDLLAHLASEVDNPQPPTPPAANPEVGPMLADASASRLPIEPIMSNLPEAQPAEVPPVAAAPIAPATSPTPPPPTPPVVDQTPSASDVPPPSPPAGLTPEQEKFIHRPSIGALIPWIYFLVNGSVKWGLIYFFLPNILGFAFGAVAQILQLIRPAIGETGFVALAIPALFIPGIAWLALFIRAILRGRKIAWESKEWKSFDDYKNFQKKCDLIIGIVFLVVIVLIGVLGILAATVLVAINPSARIAEANDTKIKSDVSYVQTGIEACFVQEQGSYTACSSVSTLKADGYIKTTGDLSSVHIDVLTDGSEAIAFAQLKAASAKCDYGSGTNKYVVYSTSDGTTKIYCQTDAPTADQVIELRAGSTPSGQTPSSTTPTLSHEAALKQAIAESTPAPTPKPTPILGTSNDTEAMVILDQWFGAAEVCYAAQSPKSYKNCSSRTHLASYVSVKPPYKAWPAGSSVNSSGTQMMMYTELTQASCQGAGATWAFYVYRTTTKKTTVECAMNAPLSNLQ